MYYINIGHITSIGGILDEIENGKQNNNQQLCDDYELDEAIEHLRHMLTGTTKQWNCDECRKDHENLYRWLQELKSYRKRYRQLPLMRNNYRF